VRCPICREGELRPGRTSLLLERDGRTIVVRHVPALVCENCGEAFVAEPETAATLAHAERAVQDGVTVEVREYAAA